MQTIKNNRHIVKEIDASKAEWGQIRVEVCDGKKKSTMMIREAPKGLSQETQFSVEVIASLFFFWPTGDTVHNLFYPN